MKKAAILFMSALTVLGCIYAIHDCQTAQGIGYYFALKVNGSQRFLYDLCADLAYFLMLFLLVFIPSRIMFQKWIYPMAKLLLLYCAMMPLQRTDYVFSLIFNTSGIEKESMRVIATNLFSAIKVPSLVLCLSVGFYLVIKGRKITGKLIGLIAASFILSVISLFGGLFAPGLIFAAVYCVIVSIFICLEKAEFDSLIFYSFLFVAAVYNILFISSAWSI